MVRQRAFFGWYCCCLCRLLLLLRVTLYLLLLWFMGAVCQLFHRGSRGSINPTSDIPCTRLAGLLHCVLLPKRLHGIEL
jgi:hypothetical protein